MQMANVFAGRIRLVIVSLVMQVAYGHINS